MDAEEEGGEEVAGGGEELVEKGTSSVKVVMSCSVLGNFSRKATTPNFPLLRRSCLFFS